MSIKQIESSLKKEFSNSFTIQQSDDNALFCSCRDWGHWQVPDGEDEEDYDWEELSENSYEELVAFIAKLRTKFPDFSICFETGEKNYIDFRVRKDAE